MIQSSAIPTSSALLQGNSKAIAFQVERSFEIGVGGDKLDVIRHRVHVMGQKEATGTHPTTRPFSRYAPRYFCVILALFLRYFPPCLRYRPTVSNRFFLRQLSISH